MLNLLSGEFLKLRKAKSFYVCCILMVVLTFWIYGMLMIAEKINQGEIDNGTVGVTVSEEKMEETEGSIKEAIGMLDVYQQVACKLAALVTIVFTSIFVISEFGNGAVKNLAGKGYGRGRIFLAKYLVVEIASAVLFLICAASVFIGGCIFYGTGEIGGAFLKNYLVYTLFQLVLTMVFNGIIAAVGEVSRSLGIGITAAICILSFSSLFFMGLDLVFHGLGIKPSNYWITELMINCPFTGADIEFVIHFVIASVFWTAAAAGVGLLHFKKADIK